MNNVKYESTSLIDNRLIFSVNINGVKYTAFTDYNLNLLDVLAPISIKEWIKQECPSTVLLPEAPVLIKAAVQQSLKNWWSRNKNYFDEFYSYSAS